MLPIEVLKGENQVCVAGGDVDRVVVSFAGSACHPVSFDVCGFSEISGKTEQKIWITEPLYNNEEFEIRHNRAAKITIPSEVSNKSIEEMLIAVEDEDYHHSNDVNTINYEAPKHDLKKLSIKVLKNNIEVVSARAENKNVLEMLIYQNQNDDFAKITIETFNNESGEEGRVLLSDSFSLGDEVKVLINRN